VTKALAARMFLVAAVIAAVALPVAAAAPAGTSAKPPVIEMKTKNLGKVIATPAKLGIYFWATEKKAKGKIRCTGSCAKAWPPVYVKGKIAKHYKGVMATLGTIKRGNKRQLTVNGLPAYTYHGDSAGIVLCDNVDGWFAVRV
jgi:predicted lipoprotein with Yx(FWY)xxD motif